MVGLVAVVVRLLWLKLLEVTAVWVWWKLSLMLLLMLLHLCGVIVTECCTVAVLNVLVVGLRRIVSRGLVVLKLLLTWLRLTAGSVIGRLEWLSLKLWWVRQGTL